MKQEREIVFYILHGEDEYSIAEALNKIKKAAGDRELLDVNTNQFDAGSLSLNQLRAVCESVPFLAEKRMVIVEGLLTRFDVREKSPKRGATASDEPAELKQIVDCAGRLPESTLLVLVDIAKIKESNPLLKLLAAKGKVIRFPLKQGNELRLWIEERVNKEGGIINPAATRLLASLVGGNLRNINNETKKLVLFTAGRPITEQDVKAVVSEAQEASVFTMIDAAFEDRVGQAEQILQQLLDRGVSPGNILTMLSRQVRMLILAVEMKSQGKQPPEIRSRLGITRDFIWHKLSQQVDKYPMEQLKMIYRKLLETDLSIKTGKYDEEIALNMLVAEVGGTRKGNLLS